MESKKAFSAGKMLFDAMETYGDKFESREE